MIVMIVGAKFSAPASIVNLELAQIATATLVFASYTLSPHWVSRPPTRVLACVNFEHSSINSGIGTASTPDGLSLHTYRYRTMIILRILPLFTALPFVLSKPCTTRAPIPTPCYYDRWHQEIKTRIGPDGAANVQCWDFGANTSVGNRWFFVRDRQCWLSPTAVSTGCGCKCEVHDRNKKVGLILS